MEGTSWSVVQELGLVASPNPNNILVYGSSDPTPNPAELLLTQLVANQLGLPWRFFVYRNGRNLYKDVPENYINPQGVFFLENIIPEDMNLRDLAKAVWRLRQESVIVAHLPLEENVKKIRTTSEISDVPDISVARLHEMRGWLGGSSIHYLIRLYAEKNPQVVFACPFQMKGLVYQIYQGVGRGLFVLTPFVRIAPQVAPQGWEPIKWEEWLSLPAAARRLARQLIQQELKNFFRWGGPPRIEIPWGWWSFR